MSEKNTNKFDDLPIVQEIVNEQIGEFVCHIRQKVQDILMDSLLQTLGVEKGGYSSHYKWRSKDGLVRDILLRETDKAVRQNLNELVSKALAKVTKSNSQITKAVEAAAKNRYGEIYRRSLLERIETLARVDAAADIEVAIMQSLRSHQPLQPQDSE